MNELKFYIVYTNSRGATETTLLNHSPDGWDDNFIEIERSTEFHGFMTSFIPKLKFVKDGALLLRDLFYTNFPNYFRAYLKIEKLNKVQLTYSQCFYGEIKFDTFIDDDNFVEVTIAEGGLSTILKANMDTAYDIYPFIGDISFRLSPADASTETVGLNITSLLDTYLFKKVCSNDLGFGYTFSGATNPIDANGSYEPAGIYNGEQYYLLNNYYCLYWSSAAFFGGSSYWVIIQNSSPDDTKITNSFYVDYIDTPGGTWSALGSWTYSGPAIAVNTNPYGIDTSFFNTYVNQIVITTGQLIRLQSAAITDYPDVSISLTDIYKTVRTVFSVGMGIELVGVVETLVFKKINDFYDNVNEIENIGEITSELKFSVWDMAVNSVKIGYPEKTYSNSTDVLECNGESVYYIGRKVFKNELDLVSKFRGDGTGISDIKLGSAQDSDIFIVCIDDFTTYYALSLNYHRRISNNATILEQFNTRITPERCLIVNQDLISSLTFGASFDNYYLSTPVKEKEKDSYKNVLDTETSFDGGATYLKESKGIALSDGTKFLLPFIFEITAGISENFLSNFNAHPNGFITFTYDGVSYKGFILSAKPKVSGKCICDFKLISAPDNVLTTLIR